MRIAINGFGRIGDYTVVPGVNDAPRT